MKSHTRTANPPKWFMHSSETRRYEEIDLDDCELVEGQTVMLMFYSLQGRRYMTVPGASLHIIRNGQPVLDRY